MCALSPAVVLVLGALLACMPSLSLARPRSVLSYMHAWNRGNATLNAYIDNARENYANGALTAVALEAWTVAADLTIQDLPTASSAMPLDAVFDELVATGLETHAWLINEAGAETRIQTHQYLRLPCSANTRHLHL